MKKTLRCLCLLLGVIIVLNLFGCGKQKYNLIFDGYGFESKKTAYAAGDQVTVYYKMIATDTDYNFWADDDMDLSQDYSSRDGYVFTFTMPEHDVTLHYSSRNSMIYNDPESLNITISNSVEKADFWVLPQTEKNLKSSLWGTATVKDLEADSQRDITLAKTDEADRYIVNIIDTHHAYFSAKDLQLEDGCVINFKTEDSSLDAVIEVLDADGNVLSSHSAFVGTFGAS